MGTERSEYGGGSDARVLDRAGVRLGVRVGGH